MAPGIGGILNEGLFPVAGRDSDAACCLVDESFAGRGDWVYCERSGSRTVAGGTRELPLAGGDGK